MCGFLQALRAKDSSQRLHAIKKIVIEFFALINESMPQGTKFVYIYEISKSFAGYRNSPQGYEQIISEVFKDISLYSEGYGEFSANRICQCFPVFILILN